MTKTEYRMVCAHHGERGHSSHAYPKGTLAKAEQSKIDSDHRAEMAPTDYYAGEAPWVVESREVGAWEAIG